MRMATILVGLLVFPVSIPADEEPRLLTGHVVDAAGAPVAGVDVTTFWNANGITKERLQEIQKTKEELNWSRDGVMEPWGAFRNSSTIGRFTTGADGEFSIPVHEDDYKVMAIDAKRQRGGLGVADPDDPETPLQIVLRPLVRVHGTLRVDGEKEPRNWCGAIINLPVHQRFPLGRDRLAFCGSDRSRLAFLLPPGQFVLHAYTGNESDQDNPPPSAETFPDVTFNVTGEHPEVDLGDIVLSIKPTLMELAAKSKSRGTWGDYTKRYGQPAPDWHVVDAKGASKDVQPRDFRGKWLALYFWGPYCRPCLKTGLPSLIDFDQQHAEQRDRYELIAFCLDKDAGIQSIADVDRLLKPVSENAWGGRSLDIPVLLDSSFETYERYGLVAVGHLILVDPAGNLREGDLETLAQILAKSE